MPKGKILNVAPEFCLLLLTTTCSLLTDYLVRLGFHISIAGGFSKVIPQAQKLGCETIQFFSRSPRSWKPCLASDEEIVKFKGAVERVGIAPLFLHASYLLNLATSGGQLYWRSIAYLSDELLQAQRIGAHYVIVHPGNRMSNTEDQACRRVSLAINQIFQEVPSSVRVLVENTAGQGTEIGFTFFQLKKILDAIDLPERMGICIDTAHAFAAGYEVSTRTGLEVLCEEVDATIGLDRIKVIHLNDTRSLCGSRVDRHWHIGKGEIGRAGFKNIVNHPAFNNLPAIMETPRKTPADDARNMRMLRRILNKREKMCDGS